MNYYYSQETLDLITVKNKEGYWCPVCSGPLTNIYQHTFKDLCCSDDKTHHLLVCDSRFANSYDLRFRITREDRVYCFLIDVKAKTAHTDIYQNKKHLLRGALLQHLDNFNIEFLIEQADTYLLFS